MLLVVAFVRRRAVITFWVTLLLVLAASPLTAPFSSCSIWDFLVAGDVPAGAVLQAKPVKADQTASPGAVPPLPFVQVGIEAFSAPSASPAVQQRILHIPLRL